MLLMTLVSIFSEENFTCENGVSIPISKKCDGNYDCRWIHPWNSSDVSDEKQCCKFHERSAQHTWIFNFTKCFSFAICRETVHRIKMWIVCSILFWTCLVFSQFYLTSNVGQIMSFSVFVTWKIFNFSNQFMKL